MVKMQIEYQGDLHCRLTHGPSGSVISTDAPVDNHGKGQAFSPTDLVGAALGSCMATIMAMVADRHSIDLRGMKVDVTKDMVAQPFRRIGKLTVVFSMPKNLPQDQRDLLKNAALTCPVHKSLSPDVTIDASFRYPE